MKYPKITVAIPSYNRAEFLRPLLDSILIQDYQNYEILIIEDKSPEREDIGKIISKYQTKTKKIRYLQNEKNLGYDKNIRKLIDCSSGDYVFFMGNDDIVAENALSKVADLIINNNNIGAVIRSYQTFKDDISNITGTFRYTPQDRILEISENGSVIAYRRSVVISGLVLKRETCLLYATEEIDGLLLYQVYLILQIMKSQNAVLTSKILSYYRTDIPPDFGNNEVEKNFTPSEQTAASSLKFIQGLIDIPRLEIIGLSKQIQNNIFKDLANYSYPLLEIQRKRSFLNFIPYGFKLAKLGFWKYSIFWLYFVALIILGSSFCNYTIKLIKKLLGYTPQIGFSVK